MKNAEKQFNVKGAQYKNGTNFDFVFLEQSRTAAILCCVKICE